MNDPTDNNTNSKEVYSMFPVENEELLYTRWEDKVIWDATVSKSFLAFHLLKVNFKSNSFKGNVTFGIFTFEDIFFQRALHYF